MTTNNVSIVEAAFAYYQSQDRDAAIALYAEDFSFSGRLRTRLAHARGPCVSPTRSSGCGDRRAACTQSLRRKSARRSPRSSIRRLVAVIAAISGDAHE